MAHHRNHVESRSSRTPARQYVAESHDHKADAPKRPVGRPRKYAGKRPTWTVRLEPQIGDQIREIAAKTGRSLSEVCEACIKQALENR